MEKGDKVQVKAILETSYNSPEYEEYFGFVCVHSPSTKQKAKRLYRKETDFTGVVIGHSYLATGNNYLCNYSIEPGYLQEDKRHKVWLVEPLTSDRYFKPLACFEDDLEVI